MAKGTTPTGSNQDKKRPAALSQEKLKEGYNIVHLAYAVVSCLLGCFAAWHYAYSIEGLGSVAAFGLAVGYNFGIIISGVTVWYVIESFKAGELADGDVWKARVLKTIALLDETCGMISHGSLEVAQIYFTWGLAVFTLLLFIFWGLLYESSERMMMIRRQARVAIDDYMDGVEAWAESRRDARALKREQHIYNAGRRKARIAFAKRVSARMVWKIKYSPIKSWKFGQVADEKINELFGKPAKNSGDGQARIAGSPVHDLSINYQLPAEVTKAKKKTTKRRVTKCRGCGEPLPKEFNEKPWNSVYCPNPNLDSPQYGQPWSKCKTAKSRATA